MHRCQLDLDDPPSPEKIAALQAAFRFRSLQTIIVPVGGLPSYDPQTLDGTIDSIPASARQLVNEGQITFSWQPVAGVPSLVVGGRVVVLVVVVDVPVLY